MRTVSSSLWAMPGMVGLGTKRTKPSDCANLLVKVPEERHPLCPFALQQLQSQVGNEQGSAPKCRSTLRSKHISASKLWLLPCMHEMGKLPFCCCFRRSGHRGAAGYIPCISFASASVNHNVQDTSGKPETSRGDGNKGSPLHGTAFPEATNAQLSGPHR